MQSLTLPRRIGANGFGPSKLSRAVNFAIPVALAALAASAAYAGADTTFTPALTKFTLHTMFYICSAPIRTNKESENETEMGYDGLDTDGIGMRHAGARAGANAC